MIDSSSECKQSRDLDGALRMNVGGENETKRKKVRNHSTFSLFFIMAMKEGSDSDSVVLFPQAKGDFGLRMNYALNSIGYPHFRGF